MEYSLFILFFNPTTYLIQPQMEKKKKRNETKKKNISKKNPPPTTSSLAKPPVNLIPVRVSNTITAPHKSLRIVSFFQRIQRRIINAIERRRFIGLIHIALDTHTH